MRVDRPWLVLRGATCVETIGPAHSGTRVTLPALSLRVCPAAALELLSTATDTRLVSPDLGHTLPPDHIFLICPTKSAKPMVERLSDVSRPVPTMSGRRAAGE